MASDPLIATAVLLGVLDRLGEQKRLIASGGENAAATGGGGHYTRISSTGVYAVERDLIHGATAADSQCTGEYVVRSLAGVGMFLSALQEHFRKAGYRSLGDVLAALEERVEHHLAELWWWHRTEKLDAARVFLKDAVTLGNLTKTAGVWTFGDGSSLGTGSGAFAETNHAPQPAHLKVVTKGATPASVTLTVKNSAGTLVASDALAVAGNAAVDSTVAVTIAGSPLEILDVTAGTVTGGDNLDELAIISVPERSVAL